MRVGVTGASGFVGTSLMPALELAGHEAIPLSRPLTNCEPGPLDAVIHLAGIAHARGTDRAAYERANVETSRDAGELALRTGAKLLIFLSSSKVYGDDPGPEPLTGASPTAPKGPYAETKLAAEQVLSETLADHVGLVVLRPPVIYGPGVKGNLGTIKKLIDLRLPVPQLSCTRSYLSIERLCDALCDLVERHPAPGVPTIRVIADGSPVGSGDLFGAIGTSLGKRPIVLRPPESLAGGIVAVDRVVLGGRYSALYSDLHLSQEDMTGLLPDLDTVDTLQAVQHQLT